MLQAPHRSQIGLLLRDSEYVSTSVEARSLQSSKRARNTRATLLETSLAGAKMPLSICIKLRLKLSIHSSALPSWTEYTGLWPLLWQRLCIGPPWNFENQVILPKFSTFKVKIWKFS